MYLTFGYAPVVFYFLDVPLILFLRDYTFDDVTTTPLLVGYVISIFATSQNSL